MNKWLKQLGVKKNKIEPSFFIYKNYNNSNNGTENISNKNGIKIYISKRLRNESLK